jgi:hypothetical protein
MCRSQLWFLQSIIPSKTFLFKCYFNSIYLAIPAKDFRDLRPRGPSVFLTSTNPFNQLFPFCRTKERTAARALFLRSNSVRKRIFDLIDREVQLKADLFFAEPGVEEEGLNA